MTHPAKAVTNLRDRLEAIASLMEASREYTPLEVYLWRLLAAYVDHEHFDRTGQIMTMPLKVEDLAPEQTSAAARLVLAELNRAVQSLEAREHLAIVSPKSSAELSPTFRYRLFLHQAFIKQPEY